MESSGAARTPARRGARASAPGGLLMPPPGRTAGGAAADVAGCSGAMAGEGRTVVDARWLTWRAEGRIGRGGISGAPLRSIGENFLDWAGGRAAEWGQEEREGGRGAARGCWSCPMMTFTSTTRPWSEGDRDWGCCRSRWAGAVHGTGSCRGLQVLQERLASAAWAERMRALGGALRAADRALRHAGRARRAPARRSTPSAACWSPTASTRRSSRRATSTAARSGASCSSTSRAAGRPASEPGSVALHRRPTSRLRRRDPGAALRRPLHRGQAARRC